MITFLSPPDIDEIVKTVNERMEKDVFMDFMSSDLIASLPYADAKPFLKGDSTAEGWKPESRKPEHILWRMHDYMAFAWGKANDRRGLSVMRSLQHFAAWAFLRGERDLATWIEDTEYTHYTKPHLRAICAHYGWNWVGWDDGFWTNDEMHDGVPAANVESLALPKSCRLTPDLLAVEEE